MKASIPHRAFTLVELLIVMVIMVILATLAAPRFANFSAQQSLEAAARRVTVDIEFVRRRARNTSTAHTITFDTVAESYQVTGFADPDHPAETYTVDLSLEPYRAAIVSANFGGLTTLTFDGFGAGNSAGSIVIQVGTYQQTVSVDAH